MDLIRMKLDSYDPLHPAASTPEVFEQCKAQGVNLPASGGTIEAFDTRILSDPALRKSFRFFIVAGLGLTFTPQANDLLKTSEGYCRILGATPLNPAGDGAIIFNIGSTLEANVQFDDTVQPTLEEQLVV